MGWWGEVHWGAGGGGTDRPCAALNASPVSPRIIEPIRCCLHWLVAETSSPQVYNEPHTTTDIWLNGNAQYVGVLDLIAAVRKGSPKVSSHSMRKKQKLYTRDAPPPTPNSGQTSCPYNPGASHGGTVATVSWCRCLFIGLWGVCPQPKKPPETPETYPPIQHTQRILTETCVPLPRLPGCHLQGMIVVAGSAVRRSRSRPPTKDWFYRFRAPLVLNGSACQSWPRCFFCALSRANPTPCRNCRN